MPSIIRKHAIYRDHGIVAGSAAAQRLIATGGQIHLVPARRELLDKLIGGFGVVLDHQDTAVTSGHGLPSPNAWLKAGLMLPIGRRHADIIPETNST